jgi:hypothetical protein
LVFIAWIEMIMQNMYGYFNYSSKWHLEFQKFAQILDTKGKKIMKNVKTRWMSMLENMLKWIMVKYHPLFTMMQVGSNSIQVTKVHSTNPFFSLEFVDLVECISNLVHYGFDLGIMLLFYKGLMGNFKSI